MPAPNNFDSIVVGYYEGRQLIYVARIRNGFTPASRAALFKHFRGLDPKAGNGSRARPARGAGAYGSAASAGAKVSRAGTEGIRAGTAAGSRAGRSRRPLQGDAKGIHPGGRPRRLRSPHSRQESAPHRRSPKTAPARAPPSATASAPRSGTSSARQSGKGGATRARASRRTKGQNGSLSLKYMQI